MDPVPLIEEPRRPPTPQLTPHYHGISLPTWSPRAPPAPVKKPAAELPTVQGVQVGVIIAMPTATGPDHLPEYQIGVANVPWDQEWTLEHTPPIL